MRVLLAIFFVATIASFVLMSKATKNYQSKGKYLISGIVCFMLTIVFYYLSPKEEVKDKETNTATVEVKKEEKPKGDTSKVQQEPKETKSKEQPKADLNSDKATYENEIKPKIDAMIKEYDEIWNQEWRPIWAQASKDPKSVSPSALKEKMDIVSSRYDDLSKKNTNLKETQKINDPILKEKLDKFKVELGLAINYRSNAASVVTQWIKGLAPMESRMEESKKSVQLSDEKLLSAVANLTEVESKLGVKRK
ncbi:ribonuclease [Bacillus cereus]|uniref:ribonuclease n=1 Tax=Bacillus cereus TaxID=1396 RepID=UPI0018D14B91|nr:ribonuclease [Bacillus cereus]MBH0323403.1 ribonuclease [Bacillus cereus]